MLSRSEEESDDEDDDEEELQAELQRIKAEREQAQAKKLQEDEELELRLKRESAMRGNPLAMIEENSAKVSVLVLVFVRHFTGVVTVASSDVAYASTCEELTPFHGRFCYFIL
jgi:urease accessory protein UreE